MTHIQNIHFQLPLSSMNHNIQHFEYLTPQEHEFSENIRKFRKLNQQHSYDYTQVPSNLYERSQKEISVQETVSLKPRKTLIKGLYENREYPKSEMMMSSESPLAKGYHSHLENMKQVGQSQQSQIQKQIIYKKSLSLSTASCSPNIEDEFKSASPINNIHFNTHCEDQGAKGPVLFQKSAQEFESCETRVPGKIYHNLAENQMKTVQAVLIAKRNSQMNNIPNQRGHMHGLSAQKASSEGYLHTMRAPMLENREMVQRINAYRAMQYRFAVQQRWHYMMQQKLLQNNQILENHARAQICNTKAKDSQIPAQKKFIEQDMPKSSKFIQDEIMTNSIEDIDMFFRSSSNEPEDLSPFRDSFSDTFNNIGLV